MSTNRTSEDQSSPSSTSFSHTRFFPLPPGILLIHQSAVLSEVKPRIIMGYKYVPTTQMMIKFIHQKKISANSLRSTKSVSVYISKKAINLTLKTLFTTCFSHNTYIVPRVPLFPPCA